MATYQKFQQYVEDLHHGVHNFSADALEVALCNNANAPSLSLDAVLLDIVVITYTNLSTRVVTTNSSGHTTGTYTLSLVDLTLSASGGAANAFQHVVLFNQSSVTPTDALICMFDYGSDLILADGESLTIDFATDGGPNGNLFTMT